ACGAPWSNYEIRLSRDSGLIYIDSEIGDPEFNSGPGSAPLLSC
ncbi:hypothetical protein LCGC14_1504370, partial [marine sediment metagenome]